MVDLTPRYEPGTEHLYNLRLNPVRELSSPRLLSMAGVDSEEVVLPRESTVEYIVRCAVIRTQPFLSLCTHGWMLGDRWANPTPA